ncbi:hypothetical protein FACS1894180_5190 [Bacteroidia bacterium]|nr:hypothetical protein FACS1894180_5190 [Bacteroidia bacterium]
MIDIHKITVGELRPFLPDTRGDDYYSPLFCGLAKVGENFQPLYKIDFSAPLLSAKVKYYKRLIDNSITAELNALFELLDTQKSDNLILFHRKKLHDKVKSALQQTQRYITHNQYDLQTVTSKHADFSNDLQHAECTCIFNYLITALIRCYMEFQSRYVEFIEEDKRVSIPEFYVQVLKIAVPDKTFIQEIQAITIEPQQPTAKIQAEPKEKDFAVQLEEDNYNRFMQETQPCQFAELQKYRTLSTENQMRLIRQIVGQGVPYAVAMLEYLGYPERLKTVYSMNKEKQYSHIAKCLNAVVRSVKGNFLVLNPNSNEDRLKYTAAENEQSVKDFYFSLTDKML